jgi:hypothetical protein
VNLEFSLSELLERLIPGAIFVVLICLVLKLDIFAYAFDDKKVVVSIVVFCFSYSIGTAFNIVSTFVTGKIPSLFERKDYFQRSASHVPIIHAAVADYFKIVPGKESWKLCYGICHKNGYTVKTELFSRLFVFCKSLTVCFFIVLITHILAICISISISWQDFFITVGLFLACIIFVSGSRTYSRAFTSSIYEGFYSYYCSHIEHPKPKSVNPDLP